jgi:hypothetical protein
MILEIAQNAAEGAPPDTTRKKMYCPDEFPRDHREESRFPPSRSGRIGSRK